MNADVLFFDTNVLVYLFDEDEPRKQAIARALLRDSTDIRLSTQVLAEFYVTVTRKLVARRKRGRRVGWSGRRASALPQRRGQGAQLWLQLRQVSDDNEPDCVPVDVEVGMHQRVTHPDNLPPRDTWRQRAGMLGNTRCGLADNLDVAENPDLNHFICVELSLARRLVALNCCNGIKHIRNTVAVEAHRAGA